MSIVYEDQRYSDCWRFQKYHKSLLKIRTTFLLRTVWVYLQPVWRTWH